MTVSNKEFLVALFAEDAPWAHVTDFSHDPGAIPAGQHLTAWRGDYACRYALREGTNQYFTISVFAPDDEGVARRRKALFARTRVIVLDDVREKLNIEEVNKLPEPAYILETSAGSEQWGYILDVPCSNRHQVENLLDGLVANGLAPEGKDPGMKGVTRYVRLPNGVNTKSTRLVDGAPFRCRLLSWNPANHVTLEALAAPFDVDLDAVRREGRVDGAADLPDHPLLPLVTVKSVLSAGRFDITCPWVDEHTGAKDDGAAVWTNEDASIGFKCHHGSCEGRTSKHLTAHLEVEAPGFGSQLTMFRVMRDFAQVGVPDFTAPAAPQVAADPPAAPDFTAAPLPLEAPSPSSIMDELRRINSGSDEAKQKAEMLLKIVDTLRPIDQATWHDDLCHAMGWNQTRFKGILKSLRTEWYARGSDHLNIYDTIIYVKELDKLYDTRTGMFYSPQGFQNSYAHDDAEAKKTALEKGMAKKVDKLNFAPNEEPIYFRDGLIFGNTWVNGKTKQGAPGDCSMWLEHWDRMGWGEHRDHMLKWMAYTLKHPETKINHMLLLGGGEGTGKDFLLYPLLKALGEYGKPINGKRLLDDYSEYLLTCKYLNINETEMGDHKMAGLVSNVLKEYAAAPPETLEARKMYVGPVAIDNIVSVAMTTNSKVPIKVVGVSRRLYAMWTTLNIRDHNDEMMPEWVDYWDGCWGWMKFRDGVDHCIWYLLNCVDLSDFSPGAPPPMTNFLRDITESCKSGAQLTVEGMIRGKVGAFGRDLLTSTDAMATVKAAALSEETASLIMDDVGWFTAVKIGRVLKDINGVIQLRAIKGYDQSRLWVIRDQARYEAMTSRELYDEYYGQLTGNTK